MQPSYIKLRFMLAMAWINLCINLGTMRSSEMAMMIIKARDIDRVQYVDHFTVFFYRLTMHTYCNMQKIFGKFILAIVMQQIAAADYLNQSKT